MKTPNPKPVQIPRLAPATALGSQSLKTMKPKLRIIELLLVVLCGAFATTAAFGQTLYVWNPLLGNANGTNLATAANWTTNGTTPAVSLPNGASQDTAQWDNTTNVDLVISYSGTGAEPTLPGTGFGTSGINLVLTANQTNKVQLISYAAQANNVGLNNITVNGPGGQIAIGGGVPGNVWALIGRPAGGTHDWINNSTNPAIIYPNMGMQAGGGAVYTIVFDGSGDWRVTNTLANANNTGIQLAKLGTGTWYWNGPTTPGNALQPNSTINSPLTFGGGKVVLQWNNILINNDAIQNVGDLLKFDATSQAQTLNGAISGSGALEVANGTLTLGGQNTYYGTNILSGGVLIVNAAENPGTSGPLGEPVTPNSITFTGGTLQFSVNNVYDYSPRFDSSAGQQYKIDSGGQSVAFTNNLTSSGGTVTKLGNGTLTLAGTNSYSGASTVSAGKLVFEGPMSGTGNITVADGAALGVYSTATQLAPNTLTLGSSSGAILEFNNVSSTTTAPLAPVNIASAGTQTININSGTLAPGSSYPLLSWTSGTAPGTSLGILNGFIGNLTTNGSSIKLNITATAYKWSGSNNANWDTTTANNWIQNSGPVVYGANGPGPALFDDTAAGNFSITLNSAVTSTLMTVNNSANAYSFTSSGGNNIGGSTPLKKQGSGTLTLSGGANTYTGATTLSGGTVSVGVLANGGSASDIGQAASAAANLVLDGGTLQYSGAAATIDRLFTVTTGSGTIDASGTGPLAFNNTGALAYGGNGPRTLILTGTLADTNTLASVYANNGGASALTKNGSGSWVLTGNNTYSGVTTINNGVLQIGAGGSTGSAGSGNIVDNGSLIFNRNNSLTVSGVISGTGTLTVTNGTVILTGNNTLSSVAAQASTTVITNGATLQLGNGGGSGRLDSASGIVDNGTLVFNSSAAQSYVGFFATIVGSGNVSDVGSGLVKLIGNNSYSGWTSISPGATLQLCEGNQGNTSTSVITNNGILKLVRQDYGVFFITNNILGSGSVYKDVNNPNDGDVGFLGQNTYAGGTYIAGGSIMLGDGGTAGAGSIVGSVLFTNTTTPFDTFRSFGFNRPDDFTFTNVLASAPTLVTGAGASPAANQGAVVKWNTNKVTLTANNTYSGGTIVSNGVLVVGNGGTTGAIGTNTANVQGSLLFNRSDAVTFSGGITGTGLVAQVGSGTLTLSGGNTLTGSTVVSNGTLVIAVQNVGGELDVRGGKLIAGSAASVSTLNVASNMNISAGTVTVNLNKSLSPSNTIYAVAGTATASGGTLKLVNLGSSLVAGDKFYVFTNAVAGGATMTVSGLGYTFNNNLASDGSVSVATVLPPPALSFATSGAGGTTLTLSWPASWTGLHVQSQTNSISVGLSSNWVTIPGTDASNSYVTTIDKTKPTVFYRLAP